MIYRATILLILVMLFAACTPAATQAPATLQRATSEAVTAAPAATLTATTSASELTPIIVTSGTVILPPSDDDSTALELLSGSPNTCSNAEDYANLLSFEANYTDLKASNKVRYLMTDAAGNVLSEDEVEGENKNGQEGWGIYPLAYNVPADTLIRIEATVYTSANVATSRSVLVYNCTTGEAVETSLTENP